METLKELAEKYYVDNIFCDGITEFEHDIAIRCYIAGAKDQAEKMYSEEEVIRILDKREDYLGTEPSIFDYLTNEEWFQLFKIKQSGE
jgi:hypothetical protein